MGSSSPPRPVMLTMSLVGWVQRLPPWAAGADGKDAELDAAAQVWASQRQSQNWDELSQPRSARVRKDAQKSEQNPRLRPGTAAAVAASMDFEPQAAGASAPTHVAGCLLQKSGKFIIAEQTTNLILELEGAELDKQLGNRVEITGMAAKTPATTAGASQVIHVAGVKMLARGGCAAIAKKLGVAAGAGAAVASAAGAGAAGATAAGTAAAAGAATAAGIGAGTIAVVGGVAAAATAGGLAAVGSLPGQGADVPNSASR